MDGIQLNEQQQKAVDFCLSRIEEGEDSAIVGYAGTGKTTVVTEMAKILPGNWNITFVAYTNKAAQVIERMLLEKSLGLQCQVQTIHSLLKLNKQTIDKKTGKRRFKRKTGAWKDDPIDWTKELLFISEMGTIPNNDEAPLVYELLQLPHRKVFEGDPCQLPPVGENFGIAFDLMEEETVYLDKVVRYQGPILEAATKIRNNIKAYDAISDLTNDNDGVEGVFKVPHRSLKQHIARYVKEDEYSVNKDFCKVITWTNDAMNYWNDLIRHLIYGSIASSSRFILGQRVVCLESATAKEAFVSPTRRGYRTVKLMSASEEAVVQEIHEGYCDLEWIGKDSLKTYYLDVISEYGKAVTLHVIHEDSESQLETILKSLTKSKDWDAYWELKDWYHKINDAYSLTIQRMQGSTCKYVILDTDNFNQCRDIWRRNRIYYTGLTRSTTAVYI